MSEDTAGGTGATSKSIGGGPLIERLASTKSLSQQPTNSLFLKPKKPQIDTCQGFMREEIALIILNVSK